jgi:hypothetical protein
MSHPRQPTVLGLALVIFGCGDREEQESDPSGEIVWQVVGGFCSGGCPRRELWRDNRELQYIHEKKGGELLRSRGSWTTDALTEYTAASLEAYEDPELAPRSCVPSDGQDKLLTLVDPDGETWTVQFCGGGADLPGSLQRADAFFERTVSSLRNQTSDPFVRLEE